MRSNIAFVADFDHFDESSYFGLNDYSGNENSVSLNAMYSHYFTYRSSLIMGVSAHLQSFNERLVNDFVSDSRITGRSYDLDHDENEAGLYAEYTYAVKDRFSLVAGARGDYNSFYNKFYFTPRGHIKWNITRLAHAARLGGSGLPLDQSGHGQHRHAGHGPPLRLRGTRLGRRLRLPHVLPQLRPHGEGADRGRQPHAVVRTRKARGRHAERRLLPHAVLQSGRGRPGVQRHRGDVLQHRRPAPTPTPIRSTSTGRPSSGSTSSPRTDTPTRR